MSPSVEISEELLAEIDSHLREDETREEFIQELVNQYEAQGATSWEGYGGPP
jgi:metal-responsive CopG/Arc/MetJ family transcriptional regulator